MMVLGQASKAEVALWTLRSTAMMAESLEAAI